MVLLVRGRYFAPIRSVARNTRRKCLHVVDPLSRRRRPTSIALCLHACRRSEGPRCGPGMLFIMHFVR
jgi:hypothetical protein